jgi:hypothetical protein
MFKPSPIAEIRTPLQSNSNSFSHHKGFESFHRPTNTNFLIEQHAKQNSDVAPNDKFFEYIRNPKSVHALNVRERQFLSQVFEYVDFSEIVAQTQIGTKANILGESTSREVVSQFIIPTVLKGSCDIFAKTNEKLPDNVNEIFSKIYIDDRDRIKFIDFLRSQPSYKLYSETDKLACFDELFGHETKPAIFVNLYKLLGKVFKNESIKALDFQLSQTEQQILESIIIRKYSQKLTGK